MVRRPLPDAARHRIPRPEVILPSLLEAVRRRGGRDRHLDLAAHQPDQSARKHPADAPARRPDPEQGGEPPRAGSVAPETLGYWWSMILSENRCPLFGIMSGSDWVVCSPEDQ